MKVSVSDSALTPGSLRSFLYWPSTTSPGWIGSMLRNNFLFSSLIGAGSIAVGGSIARTQDLEPMRDHHVAAGAGGFKEARAPAEAERLKHVDLHVVDKPGFQVGSKRPLAKRKARVFCAGSLSRKWSMQKICFF